MASGGTGGVLDRPGRRAVRLRRGHHPAGRGQFCLKQV